MPFSPLGSYGDNDEDISGRNRTSWEGEKTAERFEPLPAYALPPSRDHTMGFHHKLMAQTQDWRSEAKAMMVAQAVSGLVVEHTIEPVHGSLSFFEIPIQNPSDSDQVFVIEFDNPHLSLVTDGQQWRNLKARAGLCTPCEEGMFLPDDEGYGEGDRGAGRRVGEGGSGSKYVSKCHKLYLAGREEVFLPLVYYPRQRKERKEGSDQPRGLDNEGVVMPFRGGRHAWEPWRAIPEPLEAVTIPITVRQLSTWMPAATINLHVAPKRTTIQRDFYFRHKAGAMGLQKIQIPSYLGSSLKVEAEFGSGSAAVIEGESLRLKYGVNSPGERDSFLVYFYSEEEGGFHPVETWQVYVESFDTGEAKGSVGETRTMQLPAEMRGALEVWTSHQGLTWDGGATMQWTPEATVEALPVLVSARMPGPGRVRSRLISCTASSPPVRATYQLTVEPNIETEVDLPYKSPYREGTVLTVSTDRPDALILTPTDGEICFGPHEERQLGISVKSRPAQGGSFTGFVFINDERGRSVDCFAIQVSCGSLPTPQPPGGGRNPRAKQRRGGSPKGHPAPKLSPV